MWFKTSKITKIIGIILYLLVDVTTFTIPRNVIENKPFTIGVKAKINLITKNDDPYSTLYNNVN